MRNGWLQAWPILRGSGGGTSVTTPPQTAAQEAQTQAQTAIEQQQLAIAQQQQALGNATIPLQLAQAGYTLTPQTPGETLGTGQYALPIGGTTYVAQLSPQEQQLQDMNQQIALASGQRQLAAIQGNVPIDPGLEEDINQQQQALRADLLNRLGPGAETSQPYIQAMNAFQTNADLTRFQVRYGELSNQGAMSLGSQQQIQRQQQQLSNAAMSALSPTLVGASTLGQAGGTAANIYNQQLGSQNLALQQNQIGAGMVSSGISGGLSAAGLGIGSALAL